jgi:hypothetical protein
MPNGKVMHAGLKIGDSQLMLNDEMPEYGVLSPLSTGGNSSVTIHIYSDNVDEAFNRAVSAGAQVKMPLMDQFWADRYGGDRSLWPQVVVGLALKDMSPAEMEEGMKEAIAKMPPPSTARKTA